jgi:hypothetical protein
LVIFHNCHTMTRALKELQADGWTLTADLLASFSPFRTHHLNRFGLYDLQDREPAPVDFGIRFHSTTASVLSATAVAEDEEPQGSAASAAT